jgi:hypothetical protein
MDTIVYRADGTQTTISKGYLQEVLAKITKDTTNEYDVYEDKSKGFFFILIANNIFLLVDRSTDINRKLINDYVIREALVTANNPQGVSFTLKSTWSSPSKTVRTLSEALFAAAYDRGSVTTLSDLFMYKVPIDAEAAFTTPLFLSAQPHIFVRYGPYRATPAAPTLTAPAEARSANGFSNRILVPWTEIMTKRGNIDAYLSRASPDPLKASLITVKVPGVYIINGFVQYTAVNPEIEGQEVNLRYNKASGINDIDMSAKCGPVRNGGVPFSFMKLVTEEDINSSNPTEGARRGILPDQHLLQRL